MILDQNLKKLLDINQSKDDTIINPTIRSPYLERNNKINFKRDGKFLVKKMAENRKN